MPPLDPALDPVFDAAGKMYNVNPQHLKGIALQESGGDPTKMGASGEQGLMQIMPETGKGLGLQDPMNPIDSIFAGAKYYSQGLDKNNDDPVKALMYYNTGRGSGLNGYPQAVAGQIAKLQQPQRPQVAANAASPALTGTDALAAVSPNADTTQSLAGRISGGNPPTPSDLNQAQVLQDIQARSRGGPPGPSTGGPLQMAQNGPALTGTDALAAVGKPGAGMSDEDLINGFIKGTLPFMQKPTATTPAPGAGAAGPGGAVPGTPYSAEMLQWANGRASSRAGSGMPVEEWVKNIANTAPGQPGNLQYQHDSEVSKETGHQLQQGGIGGAPVTNIPGAPQAAAATAGAVKGAQAEQEIQITRDGGIYKGGVYIGHAPKMTTVTDAQGNQYPAFTPPIGPVAPGVATPSLPGAAGAPGSSANAPTGFPPPPPGAVMSSPEKMGAGGVTALEDRAKAEQEQRQQVIHEGNTALNDKATIKNMIAEEGNFTSGPFAQYAQRAGSLLRLADPSWNGQVASYEDYLKNSGNLTRQAVRETSARAAVQEFNMIRDSLPSPETSPIGRIRVQNELLGLADFRQAKAQAQQQWENAHGGPGNVTGFETAFQTQASPYAFIVGRMDPQYRQEIFSKLKGSPEGRQELTRLGDQLNYIHQSGIGNVP